MHRVNTFYKFCFFFTFGKGRISSWHILRILTGFAVNANPWHKGRITSLHILRILTGFAVNANPWHEQ